MYLLFFNETEPTCQMFESYRYMTNTMKAVKRNICQKKNKQVGVN